MFLFFFFLKRQQKQATEPFNVSHISIPKKASRLNV